MTLSAPPAPKRPPRLVLRFAVYSAIALALAWAAIFWVVRHEAEERGQEQVARHATDAGARIAPSLTNADLAGPVGDVRRAELDTIFERELVGNLLRMTLWTPGGTIAYSTDRAEIGDRTDEPAGLQEALAGRTVQEVGSLDEETAAPGGDDAKAFESYVPILTGDSTRPAGVLEVYEAYAPVAAEIEQTITSIGVALGLALLLLYATLFPILRQVTRALDARHRGLENHASALRTALEERDKAEVRVSQAERNYRSLVEQLPLVMYITRLDETSSCIYMSPQIENLAGYTPLECMSDPEFFVRIVHPDDRERTLAAHLDAYATGESFSIKYRMLAKDGRTIWVHDEIAIAKDANGRPMHAQGFLVDVTPQIASQDERERHNAELSALHETALLLIDELDPQKLLERIAGQAGELLGTEHTYVYLRDGDSLRVAVGTGSFAGNVGERIDRGEGLAGRVWETAQPFTVDDYTTWEGRLDRFASEDLHAVVGVPLRSRTEVVGVLGLAHHDPERTFGEPEIALLSRFAHLASLALESARLYASARDELQERRRAEAALREAEIRYRTLVENLPLVTYISPVDTPVGNLYVSPQVEALLGFPADEWLRNTSLLQETVHPDDLERVLADAERLRRTGEALRSEYRYIAADGRVVWVLDETILVSDDQGTPLWVQGFLVDITESKVAEETRARLAAIIESSNDAIMSASPDLRLTSWNEGAERMFGHSAQEMLDRPITVLMPDERREEAIDLLGTVVAEDRVAHLETVRQRGDGETVHVAFTYSPIRDSAGKVVGISAIGQDVTERVRSEADRERLLAAEKDARTFAEAAQRDLAAQNERLRELDRLKDEFIALVSHELRTPLTSIRGYTELLLDGEAGDLTDDQRQFLGVVERNSHRLLHLVGDLLFLAQVEAGKLVLDVGALDLGAVASESAETARPQAEAKGITLTLATGPVPLIAGDRARIAQLLDNLISNAVKFTPEGGRVDVRVRAVKEQAVLEVRDSGMGIPAGEQEFLFQRFFRTSTANEQAIQGTGLGLAISKAIVDAHSGRITVASEEGTGTTFRVALPLRRHAEVRERAEVAS
ncbi:MAG TPA: PAS domain S-box protein [Gaiellaceae bacterium]|nr:PAS domain S-box protein [Gaiellaceae bacterium]